MPHGMVVWAIGDVHGRLDLVKSLLMAIFEDVAAGDADRNLVIFLGDYIDRGPESRGVINYLSTLPKHLGIEWRFLKGNHEDIMMRFLDDPALGLQWCKYGGEATLNSFGLRPPVLKHKSESWAKLSADLNYHLTPQELDFLYALELSLSIGDYFFAHAGARPGESLDRQTPEDLLWIRRPFLDSPHPFERMIVHGHTPTAEVHADSRRVGIDTKAYETGVLTALKLSGSERWLLQTSSAGAISDHNPVIVEDGGLTGEPIVVRRASLPAPPCPL